MDSEKQFSRQSELMFEQSWCTDGALLLHEKGYTATDHEDAKLPADIQVFDIVGDSYVMILQLLPFMAPIVQAGEEYAADGKLFSMLFCLWCT